MEQHLATVSILLRKREKNAQALNEILTKHSQVIMARLGVNVEPKCIEDCYGIIALCVQGTTEQISALTNEVDELIDATVKEVVLV